LAQAAWLRPQVFPQGPLAVRLQRPMSSTNVDANSACLIFPSATRQRGQPEQRRFRRFGGHSANGKLLLSTDAPAKGPSSNGQMRTWAMPCFAPTATPEIHPRSVASGGMDEHAYRPGELLLKAAMLCRADPLPSPGLTDATRASKLLAGVNIQAPPGLERMACHDSVNVDWDTCSTTDTSSPSSPRSGPGSVSGAADSSCLLASSNLASLHAVGRLSTLPAHNSWSRSGVARDVADLCHQPGAGELTRRERRAAQPAVKAR